MTRVKVCGLTRRADLDAAVDAGTDAVGVVCDVSVDTPREVPVERARELLSAVPPFVTGVLVTMPEDLDRARELIERIEPDAIQLHGDVDRETLASLRAEPASVLLAVDADDAERAAGYDDVVDGFVVDSADEAGGGGTGETHDWDRTRRATAELESPVVLAGGLTPENVADAVETARPFAVDVASGVEARGGVKDADAVRSFVERAKTTARGVTQIESP